MPVSPDKRRTYFRSTFLCLEIATLRTVCYA
jgi:hypothetical protein